MNEAGRGEKRVEVFLINTLLTEERASGASDVLYPSVHYTPCFGAVPGYKQGATIGANPLKGPNPKAQGPPEVVVSLVREWEEWRVASVVY